MLIERLLRHIRHVMNCAVSGRNLNMKCFCFVFIILLLLCSWIAVVDAQDESVTVEITGLPEGVQKGAFDVTITFSEAVDDFETDDITFSDDSVDASVTNLTTSAKGDVDHKKVYTAEITPADDTTGDLTFGVAENVVNPVNEASESHTVQVDLVPPSVSITGVPEGHQNGAFDITITFSEQVKGFALEDITLTGPATASLKSGSEGERVYEITITPKPDSEGDVTFQVKANAVRDLALNENTASESHTVEIDTKPPTVGITDVPTKEKNEEFDITITFSEPVNDFDATDITVRGSASSSLKSGSEGDSVYEITITPDPASEGDVTFQVPAGAATDDALNPNTASAETDAVRIDTRPPTVEITDVPDIEKNVAFDITITFSETVEGFALGDLTVEGPASSSLKSGSEGESVYEITITPDPASEGDVTFRVEEKAVTDSVGNENTASDSHTVHIDTIPPTVEITDVPDIEKNVPFDITITFSESVNDFDATGIIGTGSASSSLASGSDGGSVYKVTITPDPTSEGKVTFQVPAGAATDDALNPNTASAETDPVHIDTIPPTVEITDVPDIEKNVAFDITITFSETVEGFALGDLTVEGPASSSLKSGSEGESVYEITITPDPASEGDVTFKVPAAVAQDSALNDNTASDSHTVHIDYHTSDCRDNGYSRY